MNIDKLMGMLKEKKMNVETLATVVGVDRSSMYRKLGKAEKITIGEAAKIKIALEMSDDEAYEIFLA